MQDEREGLIPETGIAIKQQPPAPAPARPRRRVRGFEVCLLAVALAIVVLLAAVLGGFIGLARGLGGLFATGPLRQSPPANTYSIISVEGTIQTGGTGYQHNATVNYIKGLKEDEGNLGILLYMNTGGGGVFESDEVYRALMDYKAETGRPVWAYMARTCASGGYWISAAADHIISNYNVTTGSIGVYYQFTDASGLYEKLGLETVVIRTGSNKGIGLDGAEITAENRAVYQSMVDESYDRFVEIIATGRGMSAAAVKQLADGRPYTANQALQNGLVDEIADWDAAKEAFAALCGGDGYQTQFYASSGLQQLVRGITGSLPTGEIQALLDLAENQSNGLMAHADGLG